MRPKPTEKVAIRPDVTSRMLATTALESTPPDRKTPSGTSLSRRKRTASRRPARTVAALSSREARGPVVATAAGSCQYRRCVSRPSASLAVCAGGSFRIESKIERVAGVKPKAR